jgi:hypothetical protein
MRAAGQVAEFGHAGHGDAALDAPQRLQRLDHGLQAQVVSGGAVLAPSPGVRRQ